jgi:hypothetical protein
MSKSVKTIVAVAAAIAIPFAAPMIASSIGMSAAIGTAIGSATAGSVIGGAIVGAGLGAAKGAILGEDVGRSALMGGLGGGIGGYTAGASAVPTGAEAMGPATAAQPLDASFNQYLAATPAPVYDAGTASATGALTPAPGYATTPATGFSGVDTSAGLNTSAMGPMPTAQPLGSEFDAYAAAAPTAGLATGTAPAAAAAPAAGVAPAAAPAAAAAAAPPTFMSSLTKAFSNPVNQADFTLRAAGMLAGSAIAGDGLSSEEKALLNAQTEELRTLQTENRALFNQKLEQAQNMLGEAKYFDPEYFGLQRARREQVAGAQRKRAGLRGLTGDRRESEGRRYDIGTGRGTATAYDQGYAGGVTGRQQATAAGLSAMPSAFPSSGTEMGNLRSAYGSGRDAQRQAQSDIGYLFGSFTGR